ncbi:response regulator transcription factor [Streptomyces niveus]|uniref:helix-turn-helix transcriptional regulator n=1 Tax=Streptomyces niveus TaxID=193462 RepID=UPI003F4D7B72
MGAGAAAWVPGAAAAARYADAACLVLPRQGVARPGDRAAGDGGAARGRRAVLRHRAAHRRGRLADPRLDLRPRADRVRAAGDRDQQPAEDRAECRAELADAVRAASRGETVLAPSVAARLVDQLRSRPDRPRLSRRETAVLRLVAEGCTNAEIGRHLFIGESTVKTHLLRIFTKLGVTDRTAAVTNAMRHGLLAE